ncbi:MAG: MMPL family transporter [Actinomycetota bacterium]|nr:MMPL family transporter [Actinomycetota bacterium]
MPVLVFWLAAAIAALVYLPSLEPTRGGGLQGLVPQHSEAIRAEIVSFRLFGFPLLSRTSVVQRDPRGLSARAQARVFLRGALLNLGAYPELTDIPGALPVTNTLELFPSSRERSTTAITYLFFPPDEDLSDRERLARRFSQRIDGPGDALVGITGPVPGRIAEGRLIKAKLPHVELLTVTLIVLIVGLHFRALGAPIMTLMAAGLAFVLSTRGVAWAVERTGLSLPGELEPVLVVLLLGIVTDYSIFYLNYAKGRLGESRGRLLAAEATSSRISPIIVTAGLAVAVGAAGLVVATLDVFKALGPGLALTVLVGLAVSVTFIPASVAVFGKALFWPRLPRPASEEAESDRGIRTWRERITYRATRRPVAVAIAVGMCLLLVLAAVPARDMGVGFSIISGLPPGSEPRQAARAAARGFAPGILSPTVLVLTGGGLGAHSRKLVVLQQLLEQQPGVAGVVGPREVLGLAAIAEEVPEAQRLAANRDLEGLLLRGLVSERSDAARMLIVLEQPPLGDAAIESLRRIQARMPALLDASGLQGAQFGLAGDTALASETIALTLSDLTRIALAVLSLHLLLLAVFLRALLAPVYLLAASVLGFVASMGITVFVFQLLGQSSLSFFVPFAAAVLLVSLGSDYNIFLVGRIWDEARTTPLRHAIALAAPAASGAIAVAGITLAMSFGVLAVVPLDVFRQFAFTMAAGILIDSFLVRSFLVPALIASFGEASAWPGRFRRRDLTLRARAWAPLRARLCWVRAFATTEHPAKTLREYQGWKNRS